ncbi:MAG TPA: penicillin acylase family protein [Thermoanaerobaculia bacterium]|nr:penicillin acylase family protein [Thermoanaerobaculia bacterium]
MGHSYPILKRFAVFVFLPLLMAAGGALYSMRGSLPKAETRLQAAGRGPVQIVRDDQGVPVVSATRDEDVYFAMGYVHAQDRMWQLEFQRRMVQGRLSEVLGKEALQQDAWMRTLGIHRSARSAWTALSEPAKRSLTAYAEGVNAWLNEKHTLPVEFHLLGVQPEPWTVIDSLAWSKVFALNLAGNLDKETARYVAQQTLSPEQTNFFFSGKDTFDSLAGTGAPDRAQVAGMVRIGELQRSIEQELNIGGKHAGSNAWVVSGKLTGDGTAILANDPHLGLQMPSFWYPVVQQGKLLHASGMTLVGLPVVIFGQNQHIAWGGTNLTADVQDLYFERIDERGGSRYLADGKWETIETTVESIPVASEFPSALHKAIKPVRMEVRRTRNGPIISDVNGRISQPVSLRWTALAEGDRSYESFYQLSYAQDWSSFRELFRDYVAPALNMLYADHGGNIGRLVVGRIPVRKSGDGSLPVPGWDPSYAWEGVIPFDELPVTFNPEQGYIVSANDNAIGDDYPYFISEDWAPPERAARIEGLLRETLARSGRISLNDSKPIQADVISLSAKKLLPLLTAIEAKDARQQQAIDLLRTWNGAMDKESVAASIYNGWMRHLGGAMFASVIREDWSRGRERAYLANVLSGASPDVIYKALTDPRETWCSRDASASSRRCEDMLSGSLSAALDELEKLAGGDPESWKWGSIHQTAYRHQPFSQVKGLSSLFERKVASGGGQDTVAVSSYVFRPSEGYMGTLGAGFRQIIQLGPKTNAHVYMNSTGQSANVFSRHYSDMVAPFENADYHSLKPNRSNGKLVH